MYRLHLCLPRSCCYIFFLLFALEIFGQSISSPSVTIKNGTVVGAGRNGVDFFLGVPFAAPPTKSNRLERPQSITTTFGTIMATQTPFACPKFPDRLPDTDGLPTETFNALLTTFSYLPPIVNVTEDCLNINIIRPSGTNPQSRLPVVFWIYGGGFESGSNGQYDGSSFVNKSIDLKKPVIYVAPNYRVGAFGFLSGKEIQKTGATNLGLRDQRKALEWVAENIGAFGGDPDKVTLWGESAGAISVCDHTVINGGNNNYRGKPLFRGAILDSGSLWPSTPVSSPKAQKFYDQVVSAANCSTATDTLQCLKTIPFDQLLQAQNSLGSFFTYRSVDLPYSPRPDPSDDFFPVSPEIATKSGKFARVPTISGNQEDEGTLFSLIQRNVTTTQKLVQYLASYFPESPASVSAGLVALYPDDPAAGSPFRTGSQYELYPQYKRISALFGDLILTLMRRVYQTQIHDPNISIWSYQSTYTHDIPYMGTFHTTDIGEMFFHGPPGITKVDNRVYYISFINFLNPNQLGGDTTYWPQWTPQNRAMLQFGSDNNTLIVDNFRETSYKYIAKHLSQFSF